MSENATFEAVTAYHEAGHAVMAVLQDLPLEALTIEPKGDAAGYLLHERSEHSMEDVIYDDVEAWQDFNDSEREALSVAVHARNIRVSYAGEIAQRRFAPASVEEHHAATDRQEALRHLDQIVGNWDDKELYEAWATLLTLQTERAIARNWHKVEWIAQELLRKKSLTADEIREAYADAELPVEHRGKKLTWEERLSIVAQTARAIKGVEK